MVRKKRKKLSKEEAELAATAAKYHYHDESSSSEEDDNEQQVKVTKKRKKNYKSKKQMSQTELNTQKLARRKRQKELEQSKADQMRVHNRRASRTLVPVRSLQRVHVHAGAGTHSLCSVRNDNPFEPYGFRGSYKSIKYWERDLNEYHERFRVTYCMTPPKNETLSPNNDTSSLLSSSSSNSSSSTSASSASSSPSSSVLSSYDRHIQVTVPKSRCVGKLLSNLATVRSETACWILPQASQKPHRCVGRCWNQRCTFAFVLAANVTTGRWNIEFWSKHSDSCLRERAPYMEGKGHMKGSNTNFSAEQLAATLWKGFLDSSDKNIDTATVRTMVESVYVNKKLKYQKSVAITLRVKSILHGKASENLDQLDSVMSRLKDSGFIVELDEIPGPVMVEFAIKELKAQYEGYRKKRGKKAPAAWNKQMEEEKRNILRKSMDSDKNFILGWSISYKPFLEMRRWKRWCVLVYNSKLLFHIPSVLQKHTRSD